jgi:hypothetical protein
LLEAAPLKKSTVHKLLVGLEPHLRDWFASFAPPKRPVTKGLGWEEVGS